MSRAKKDFDFESRELPVRLYRTIAIGFGSAVVLMAVLVFTTTATKAEVRVTGKRAGVQSAILLDVGKEGSSSISGVSEVKEVSSEGTGFPSVGEETPGRAEGVILITNTTDEVLPLKATTRFLSKEGILFRLKERVTVPAKGKAEGTVAADKEGKEGNIGPSVFTLPALPQNMQTQIAATSAAAFTGGVQMSGVLTSADIGRIADELVGNLVRAASESLRAMRKEYEGFTSSVVSKEITHDGEIGKSTGRVVVKAKVTVAGIFYSVEDANSAISARLNQEISEGMNIESQNALQVSVDRFDAASRIATLRVARSATVAPSISHPAFSAETLAGKTPEGVKTFLIERGVAESVAVQLTPPWKRRIPNNPGKIKIILE